MKTILDLMSKLGEIPTWVYVVLLILTIFSVVFVFFKKSLLPTVYRIVKIKEDVESISDIKNKQLEIMQESIAGDQQLAAEIECLKGDIDGLHTKIDGIVDTLHELCDKEEAEGLSRAQNRLLEMYKRYGLNNESKTWGRYESEVFFNTLDSYISHGGNSFILDQVVPVMKLLTVAEDQ